MSTIALTSTNAAIERFIQLVQQGYESWIEAGRIVCEQTDNDPSFPEKVTKKHPEISEDVIYAFEQIGRRKLHPKLASRFMSLIAVGQLLTKQNQRCG